MRFAINGLQIEAEFDLRTSLLDLLRDHLRYARERGPYKSETRYFDGIA